MDLGKGASLTSFVLPLSTYQANRAQFRRGLPYVAWGGGGGGGQRLRQENPP
jgi:hypothetical protein